MKIYIAPYGEAFTVPISLVEPDGVDFVVDAVHASGDTFLTKDEGAEANSTNGFVDEGSGYSLLLTATEMEAARVHLFFIDQTGTKVWLDTDVVIMTYGHASAQYPTIGTQTGDSFARIGVNGAGLTNIDLPNQTMDITGDLSGSVGSVTAQVTADVTAISGDTTAADNLESQYDETGLVGDNFPANQAQLGNIANTGAAINRVFSGATLTTGSQVNTYVATQALDGVYHEITPAGGVTDVRYTTNIGGTGVPVSVTLSGRLFDPPVTSDDIIIEAWDYVGSAWAQVGTLDGVNSAVDAVKTVILFSNMVGTGVDSGDIQIRFQNTGLGATTVLFIDLLYVSYSIVSSAVGYANGMIWINSLNGTAGTVQNVNGTADNPVDSLADALTLSASTGLTQLYVTTGSTITLAAAMSNFTINGFNYTFDTAGYAMNNCTVYGAIINSVIAAGTGEVSFWKCLFGNCTIPATNQLYCGYGGTMILSEAGTYIINDPFSAVAGNTAPIFNCGAVGNQNLNFRHASMGIELQNFGATGTDVASVEGDGQVILAASCTAGGSLTIRGDWSLTDNAGGVVNVTDDARYNDSKLSDSLATYDGPTNAEMEARTLVAADYFDPSTDEVILSAAGIDAILDEQIGDGTITMRQSLRVLIAILAGKSGGGGTATLTFRNDADTQDVQIATVDVNGNRLTTTLTP